MIQERVATPSTWTGAGAAERHAAAELRAGHAEHVALHPQERSVAVNIDRPIDAVDLDCGGHSYLQAIRVDRRLEWSGLSSRTVKKFVRGRIP